VIRHEPYAEELHESDDEGDEEWLWCLGCDAEVTGLVIRLEDGGFVWWAKASPVSLIGESASIADAKAAVEKARCLRR
jgi:hypothetical protein